MIVIACVVAFILVCCAVYYIPSPPVPSFVKPLLYVALCLGAAWYVWTRWGG